MTKNSQKPNNATTSNVFLTQKWPNGQNSQKRIFLDTTLPLNDWKQLFRAFEQVMCGFEEKAQKPDFLAKNGQKMAKNGEKRPNENFFQKSAWNIF